MQWTIKSKLLLAFGLAGTMMVGGTAVAHWAQLQAQATQDKIVKTYGLLNDLEHLVVYINEVTTVQRAYLISGDESAIAGIPALRLDGKATAARVVAAIAGDEAQKAHFAQYLDYVQQRIVFVNKLNAARKDQGAEAARVLFATGEDDRLRALILGQFAAMKAIANDQLSAQQAANLKLQQEIGWTELTGVLLAVALLAFVALTLTRSINRNVQISVEMLGAMAEKDLSGADGEPASNDELAVAIRAINSMKQSMTGRIKRGGSFLHPGSGGGNPN
jgi:CHASE3 domain sensor protein